MVRVCAVFAVLFACGPTARDKPNDAGTGDGGSGNGGPHTLERLEVTPTNPLVQLDLNQAGSEVFTVTGEYADGTSEDLTSQATFAVTNPAVGTFTTGSTLDIPAFSTVSAEVSKVIATVGSMAGQAQITVVAYRLSGQQTDFFFVLPYKDPNGPQNKPLDFSTKIPSLDVFFLMDATGSMDDEIDNLASALTKPTTGVIDTIKANVADTEFGVGVLEDFPINPYGNLPGDPGCTGLASNENGDGTDDQPFKPRVSIGSDATAVQTAVAGLSHIAPNGQSKTIGCGNDLPEAGFEAVYQVATGAGLTGPTPTSVPTGGVGFRPNAMPVIVDVSDAVSHGLDETAVCNSTSVAYAGSVASVAHSRQQTADALNNICARVVGISALGTAGATSCTAQEYMTYLSTQTNARVPPNAWDVGTRPANCGSAKCCTGLNGSGQDPDADGLCPEVFDVSTNGTGVSTSVATGIEMLTRFAQFDVPTQTSGVMTDIDGNMLPAGYSTANFLRSVTPTSFMLPPPPPVVPNPTIDANNLQFDGVTPGTVVTFTIDAFNDFIPQTDQAQIFEATISVTTNTCNQVLDTRTVLILVPPMPIVIQ